MSSPEASLCHLLPHRTRIFRQLNDIVPKFNFSEIVRSAVFFIEKVSINTRCRKDLFKFSLTPNYNGQ